MDTILNFIKNNYSSILSIIAILISLINLVYLIINNKKNLKFEIDTFTIGDVNKKKFYMFNVNFINKSRLPIAINQIILTDNNINYFMIKSPRKLTEKESKRNNIVTAHHEVHSAKFPINILGLTSLQQFIVMYGPESLPNENITMTLCTNRGKINYKIKLQDYFIDANDFCKETSEYYD